MWVLDNAHFVIPAVEKPHSGIVANLRFDGGNMAAIAIIDFSAAASAGQSGTFATEPTPVNTGKIYRLNLGASAKGLSSVLCNGKEFLLTESAQYAQVGNYWLKGTYLYLLAGAGFQINAGDQITLTSNIEAIASSTTPDMIIDISLWGDVDVVGVEAGGARYSASSTPLTPQIGEFGALNGYLRIKSDPRFIPTFGSKLAVTSASTFTAEQPICNWLQFNLSGNPVPVISLQSAFYHGRSYQPIIDYSTPEQGLLIFDRPAQFLVLFS